jgi:hypothetical protein
MPAGMPYFAWVDPSETTFAPEHLRWDEDIFSFTLKQDEGDPASLTVVVRRPRNVAGDPIGLLGPGRKIWAWFALDCGPDLVRFRGRLVGVPTSIFEELVTLEFVARPIDLVAQKEALADTLRVLPHYDEVVIDPARRTDPEVVLEGYSAIWHYDRETHALSVSDEVTGEDGLVEFDGASEDGKVLYDGLSLSLTSGPLARVDVTAEYTWTQQASAHVDLTRYLLSHWPDSGRNYIASLTMTADDWPKPGAQIGDGWVAANATAISQYPDDKIRTVTGGSTLTVTFPDTSWFGPSSHTTTYTDSITFPTAPVGLSYGEIVTQDAVNISYATTTIPGVVSASLTVRTYVSSYSRSYKAVSAYVPVNISIVTLGAQGTAARPCTEVVSLSLIADVQHVLTDPEDGEALRIDDIKSVNLSEAIGEGTDAYLPIGDPRRRSYIATDRGNRSIEHLIALARAHLMKRARVVEIAFAPKLSRMPEITLRKNAFLLEPRIGEALGKIIGYSLALDGSDGRVKCEVRIGCAIGHGGSAVAAGGEPTYCSIDYTGADYQQFTGRMVLFDTSVGYQPPLADPNDDGINFLSALTAQDVIQVPLVVAWPLSAQRSGHPVAATRSETGGETPPVWNEGSVPWGDFASVEANQKVVEARAESVKSYLQHVPTKATFKLKPLSRAFSTDYEIATTELKIPTGYDLEAV